MAQRVKNLSGKQEYPWNLCGQGGPFLILREIGDRWSKVGYQDWSSTNEPNSIYKVKIYQGRHLIATTALQMTPHTCTHPPKHMQIYIYIFIFKNCKQIVFGVKIQRYGGCKLFAIPSLLGPVCNPQRNGSLVLYLTKEHPLGLLRLVFSTSGSTDMIILCLTSLVANLFSISDKCIQSLTTFTSDPEKYS